MELVTFRSTITLIQDHKMIMGRGQEEQTYQENAKKKKSPNNK